MIASVQVYGRPVLRFGGGGEPAAAPAPPPIAAASVLVPGPDRQVTSPQAVSLMILNELIPGLLATMVVGGLVWNSIHGLVVPQQLSDLCIAIAAFYFGVRGRGPVQVQLSR